MRRGAAAAVPPSGRGAVAGQAVVSLVDAENNGVGSDAMLLLYDARQHKAVSINASIPTLFFNPCCISNWLTIASTM